MLIEGHFWRFWGNLNPKMLSAIVWTPKRHFLASQRVFWTIMREIPCMGYFSRRVRGKNKERPYISRISPGAPLRPIGTNFGLRVHLVDIINCAKFYHNRLRGLDSVRGRSYHSHWIAMSPLTLCELLFTLIRLAWTLDTCRHSLSLVLRSGPTPVTLQHVNLSTSANFILLYSG